MADEVLTVGDVVRRWGVPDATVRRHANAGKLAGATKPEGADAWAIPIDSVIAQYGPEGAKAQAHEAKASTELADKVARLTHELDVLRAKLDGAQGIIEAKDQTIATMEKFTELATRVAQLEGFTLARQTPAIEVESTPSQPRRRWWQRGTS
jgi:hypothetical protein